MRSKKLCYILLSALFIMLGLSLNVCSDTNALQHDLVSVPYSIPYFPSSYKTDSSTGNYVIDWDNYTNATITGSGDYTQYGFSMIFSGDAYYDELESLSLKSSQSYLRFYPSMTNGCEILSTNSIPEVKALISINSSSSSRTASFSTPFSFFRTYDSRSPVVHYSSDITNECQYRLPFNTPPQLPLTNGDDFSGYITCMRENGAVCSGIWDFRNYLRTQLLPYYYTSDGFYLSSSAVDSNSGIHYNHSFRFSDMFNQNIKQFSYLSIPLYNYDDFWLDGNNFTSGRQLEFKGIFKFTESYSLHSDINTNGSLVQVRLFGFSPSLNRIEHSVIPCINKNYGDPINQFEYSCPTSLPSSYTWIYPVLEISGHDNYFWTTNGDTIFAHSFLVTDNDTTPGRSLGNNLSGNYIIGDAKNDFQSDDNADWTSSLINLFNFNMINPFTPIFSLFTSQESCAQIPTLSEFLHSEETQVCPFFSSRIRSVVTPVLGLSAMMLVFGFAVRWLGARSGNFFEDSGSIAPPGDFPAGSAGVKHVGWRRK